MQGTELSCTLLSVFCCLSSIFCFDRARYQERHRKFWVGLDECLEANLLLVKNHIEFYDCPSLHCWCHMQHSHYHWSKHLQGS